MNIQKIIILNITLNLNLLTPKNSTVNRDEFFSLIDSFLQKKSNKYDIYFYDNIYTPKFEPYFLDLNKLLPKEHINLYKSIENYESYSYNNKLVGLVNLLIIIIFLFQKKYIYIFYNNITL